MNVREFYDHYAANYGTFIWSPEVDAKLLPHTKEIFAKFDCSSGTILDVGCGPGVLKDTLGDSFHYTGIDLSSRMIFEAKQKGYQTIEEPMETALPKMDDKCSDYVVAISSLYWIRGAGTVIQEFERIARKAWIASFEEITPEFQEKFKAVSESPVYDHSKLQINQSTEERFFSAWTSPTTGIRVNARLVFKKIV